MKKIRQIAVKQATRQTFWYADRLGEIFNVKNEDEEWFEVDFPRKHLSPETFFIFKKDAEILN